MFGIKAAVTGTPGGSNSTGSGNLYGILLGMGLEWAFMGNWTTKIEADYIIYGNGDLNYANCNSQTQGLNPTNTACGTRTNSESATKLLVKVGLNYKFGVGKQPY